LATPQFLKDFLKSP